MFAVYVEVLPKNKVSQPSMQIFTLNKEAKDTFKERCSEQENHTTVSLIEFELGQDIYSDGQVLEFVDTPKKKEKKNG